MLARTRSFTFTGATLLVCALPVAFGCTGDDGNSGAPVKEATAAATVATPAESVDTPVSPAPAETAVPVNVSFDEAHAAFTGGRYQEAVTLFTGYTANHPHNPWGFYMLGLSDWKAGDLAGAEMAFNTALSLEPTHERSLYNSARVLLEEGKAGDALPRVEQAISQDSTSSEGYRLLGRTRYELGDVDEAIAAYQKALVLDGNDVWAMNNLGLIYIQQGRFEEALPALARAVELKDNSPVFQNNLGVALERTGRYSEAATAYQAALAADSGYAKASVALARVTGRTDQEGVAPADLASLSIRFQDQVAGWRNATPDSTVSVSSVDAGEAGKPDGNAGQPEQRQ
jgi:predicted Zn-dependent protease